MIGLETVSAIGRAAFFALNALVITLIAVYMLAKPR